MERFELEQDWLKKVLPEGIAIPTSTLISGPGGSGKPLIAGMLLASWLKKGGSVIDFLINSGRDYAEKIFSVYGLQPENYKGQIIYIDFDPNIESWEEIKEDHVKTNLLHAESWDLMLKLAAKRVDFEKHPPIIFGAALNILLFSPTHQQEIFQKLMEIVKSGQNSLFTVGNNVFEDKMQALEEAADNLIFTHSGEHMELHLRIERMKDVPFSKDDVVVPLSEHELRSMRSEAEKMRKHLIPLLKKI
jgi:archaellum biogenesis ATPase FlaH